MEQSTPEGSAQTTDPLPSSDDDPSPPDFATLDTLIESTATYDHEEAAYFFDEAVEHHQHTASFFVKPFEHSAVRFLKPWSRATHIHF
jgi:hypothetical protein